MNHPDKTVMLVNPPQPEADLKSSFGQGAGFILPHNLLCLGAYLQTQGVRVRVLDCVAQGVSMADLDAILRAEPWDILGLTCFTFSAPQAFKAARVAKACAPDNLVVLGGVHASVVPEETLAECAAIDCVVIGEGEKVLAALVASWRAGRRFGETPNIVYRDSAGEIRVAPREPWAVDVDALPHPDYALVEMARYTPHRGNYKVLPTYSFHASRGCPFPCTFCSASITMGKKTRYKSVPKAIEEIRILVERYGARGLIFQDSTFTMNRRWVQAFCEALIQEDFGLVWRANTRADCLNPELIDLMKRAGCHRINIGFESGSQRSLDLLKKGIKVARNLEGARMVREAGLELGASFLIGLPGEGWAEIWETIEFAKRLRSRFTQFYLPVPFPGTLLRDQCRDGTRADAPWRDYGMRANLNPVYLNPDFDPEIYRHLPDFAFHQVYSSVESLTRIFSTIHSLEELKDFHAIMGHIIDRWEQFEASGLAERFPPRPDRSAPPPC